MNFKPLTFLLCIVCFFARADFLSDGFSRMGEKAMPSVVSISTITLVKNPEALQRRVDNMLTSPHKDVFGPEVLNPPQRAETASSGFVVFSKGGFSYIVTNFHAVRDAYKIKITLHDETVLDAELLGDDQETDLAVLRVNKNLPVLKWADSDKVRIGEWAVALGNPYGLGFTLTAGVISSPARDLSDPRYRVESAQLMKGLIQTDAAINAGNSGGPLVNYKGQVVGVNFGGIAPSGGSDGIGMAIPANTARKVTENLISLGKVKRAWMGVNIQAVTNEISQNVGMTKAKGIMVAGVTEDGPAREAGILSGDIIFKLNDKKVKDPADFTRIIGDLSVGQVVEVILWRQAKEKTLKVKLQEFRNQDDFKETIKKTKIEFKDHVACPEFEFGVIPLTAQFRQRFGAENPGIQGVAISDVKEGGWAEKHALSVGTIILQINGAPTPTIEDFKRELAKAVSARGPILLFLYRFGPKFYVGINQKPNVI
jgi:serine protease Do